jgi:acyl-CoA synthetase (AMP-forming)/AMP-acid ligase II
MQNHCNMSVFIQDVCATFSKRTFLVIDDFRVSYGDFYNLLLVAKKYFYDKGLHQGRRAIVCVDNSLAFIITFFAMLLNRAVSCLVSPECTEAELRQLAGKIGCTTVIEKEQKPIYSSKDVGEKSLRIRKIDSREREKKILDISEEDLAYITFTSGSTGEPKGIKISHRNIIAALQGMIGGYQLKSADAHLCVLPLYHASGLYRNLLMPFVLGSSTVINKCFSAEQFWQQIAKYRIGFVQVVPTILRMLLQQKNNRLTSVKEHLRYIGSASAPHPVSLIEKFEDCFGITVVQGYGMSEATCGITLNPIDKEERVSGSVGRPLPHNKVRVCSDEGNLLPAGKAGHVQVRGENIMLGYLEEDSDDKIKVIDGWLKTGDYGYLDENQNLFLLGRGDQIIKRGGYRISPLSIENEVLKYSGISGAAAIGIPHEMLGQEIVCYVASTHGNLSRREILRYLQTTLPSYQLPSDIIFIRELPMSSVGKIDRKALRVQYELRRGTYQKLA